MHALDVHCFHLLLCSSKLFQIPPECMLQRHFFQQKNSAVPNRFKYRKNACFRYIVFNYFSAVPNRSKYIQSACFKDIVFKNFSAVPNRFKQCPNACLRDIIMFLMMTVIVRFRGIILRMQANNIGSSQRQIHSNADRKEYCYSKHERAGIVQGCKG